MMSTAFICATCGAQFPPSAEAPPECLICCDSRQFIGLDGQQWTTLGELGRKHRNVIQQEEPGLYSIHTEPHFAIGQRAFLLQTPQGNLLWDCLALLDQPTIDRVRDLGGIAAIAISHPHYYTSMVEWSIEFDNAPIYLHSADRQWVTRSNSSVQHWSGDSRNLLDDLVLIHTPGHFDGFQVLLWPQGAAGKGVLLSGDQPQVCLDTRWVSFIQLSELRSARGACRRRDRGSARTLPIPSHLRCVSEADRRGGCEECRAPLSRAIYSGACGVVAKKPARKSRRISCRTEVRA